MEKEYYINNYKSISKLIWMLLFSSMIISGYLVQRSFEWNSNLEDKVLGFEGDPETPMTLEDVIYDNLQEQQGSRLGLKINFGTLTLMWPFILLGIYFAIYLFLLKVQNNLNELKKNHTDFELLPLSLHSSSLLFHDKSQRVVIFGVLLVIMPVLGLLFHGYSGYFMINLIDQVVENWTNNLGAPFTDKYLQGTIIPKLKGVFWLQLILSILVLIVVCIINSKSLKIIKSFTNNGYK